MLRTSNIKPNHPLVRLSKQESEFLLAGEVPEQIRQLVIDNKRMAKRILVLETEVEEKNRVISELKNHLDDGVIEYTQQKLAFYRDMEEEVEKKVKETKEKLVQQSLQLKGKYRQMDEELQMLKKSLEEETEKNSFLLQKIESLKEYIIDIIEEKDYLIAELGGIINQQEKKSCKECMANKKQVLVDSIPKKKTAFIKKNQ